MSLIWDEILPDALKLWNQVTRKYRYSDILEVKLFLLGFLVLQQGIPKPSKPDQISTFILFDQSSLKYLIKDTKHNTVEKHDLVLDKFPCSSYDSKHFPNQMPTKAYSVCDNKSNQCKFCALVSNSRPNAAELDDQKRQINVDQAAEISLRFFNSLTSNQSDLSSLKRELSQFLHNGVILLKQVFMGGESGSKKAGQHIVPFFLGLLSNYSDSLEYSENVQNKTFIFSFLAKNKENVALVFDDSPSNTQLHCFSTQVFNDKKPVLVGKLSITNTGDLTYKIEHAVTCKYRLSNTVEKFQPNKPYYGDLASSLLRLRLVSVETNTTTYFPTVVIGNLINTFEPFLWWYRQEKNGTVTLVRKDSSESFVINVGNYRTQDRTVFLPRSWSESRCSMLNVDARSDFFGLDFQPAFKFIDKPENMMYRKLTPFQQTVTKGHVDHINMYNMISFALDSGITATFEHLVHFLVGYLSTYGDFEIISWVTSAHVLLFVRLHERSNLILQISLGSTHCFDVTETIHKLRLKFIGPKFSIMFVSVGLTVDFVGTLKLLSYETTWLIYENVNIYMKASDSSKILDRSAENKTACLRPTAVINIEMPTSPLDHFGHGDRKILRLETKTKMSQIINSLTNHHEHVSHIFNITNIYVDPASYWFLMHIFSLSNTQNKSIFNRIVDFQCHNLLSTASISPKLAPLWVFGTDQRVRRGFKGARNSQLTLFSNECRLWSSKLIDIQSHVIVYVTADFYQRYVLIDEPWKPNTKLFRLGRPKRLHPLVHVENKVYNRLGSEKIHNDLSITVVDRRENTLIDCSNPIHSNFSISCSVKGCTSYVIVRQYPSAELTNHFCQIRFNVVQGDVTLINNALMGLFIYNIVDDNSSFHLYLPADHEKKVGEQIATSTNHVIMPNRLFTSLTNSSGHSTIFTNQEIFRLCYNKTDTSSDSFCPITVDMTYRTMKRMQDVSVTVEFSDKVHCLFDLFQTVCTGETSGVKKTTFKHKYETLAVNLQSLVVLADEVKPETYLFCAPDPKDAHVSRTEPDNQENFATWWQFFKNDPAKNSHFFCTKNSLGTFYEIKLAQPNNRNTLFLHANQIHVHETPKKLAIILSLRRMCWQLKERGNELKLVWHLSEPGDLLFIDLVNFSPSQQHNRFKIGQIVIQNPMLRGLLKKIFVELEAFLQFRSTIQGTIEIFPAMTNIDKSTELVALQPESSVRPLHFVVDAAAAKNCTAEFYEIGTNLVVYFSKQVEVEMSNDGQLNKPVVTMFTMLLLRYFETKAFKYIKLSFVNGVFVLKRRIN